MCETGNFVEEKRLPILQTTSLWATKDVKIRDQLYIVRLAEDSTWRRSRKFDWTIHWSTLDVKIYTAAPWNWSKVKDERNFV